MGSHENSNEYRASSIYLFIYFLIILMGDMEWSAINSNTPE